MKRMTCYVIALVLLLGFTQCKKEQLSTPENEGNTVMITLDVNGNNSDDSRVDITNGHVTFEVGDVIHVVSGGQYLGILQRTTVSGVTKFRGSISSPEEGEQLYFYFLGNKDLEFNEYGTGCTVDISDQRTSLPLISMSQSNEVYASGTTAFTSDPLRNQCALVEFTTNDIPVSTIVTISGMKNKVNVDFQNNTITPSDEPGYISLYGKSATSRWAILLPQEGVTATATAVGYSTTGNITVPTINRNKYLPGAVNFEMEELDFDKRFSVSPIRKVYFSPGNLQYQGDEYSGIWRFAENQWDFVGGALETENFGTVYFDDGNRIIQCQNVSPSGAWGGPWIDLYCWARWTGQYSPVYPPDYGNQGNEWQENDFIHELIGNEFNGYSWKTLSADEWIYLLDSRNVVNNLSPGARYTMGTIEDEDGSEYKGLILFPDVYTHPANVTIGGAPVYNEGSNYTAIISSTDDWERMETAGAIFLPVTGYYFVDFGPDGPFGGGLEPGGGEEPGGEEPGGEEPGGGPAYIYVYTFDWEGVYWTRSYEYEYEEEYMSGDIENAFSMNFSRYGIPSCGTGRCNVGCAVRLVRDAE